MRRLLPLLLASALVLGACGGDDDGEAATTSEPNATTTAGAPSSTTASTAEATATTSAPAPTSEAPPGPGPTTPEEAATGLFDAWVAGDQVAAAQVASDPVVAELFSRSGAGADATNTFAGCFEDDGGEPVFRCSYIFEGGAMTFLVGDSDAFGFVVIGLEFTAD